MRGKVVRYLVGDLEDKGKRRKLKKWWNGLPRSMRAAVMHRLQEEMRGQ